MGIPFPKGELHSVDNVRLLTSKGKEIPCQTDHQGNQLAPCRFKRKMDVGILFYRGNFRILFGVWPGCSSISSKDRVVSRNNMRPEGGISVNTGPLSFQLDKRGNGFLDEIHLDGNEDGVFAEDELIASSIDGFRGSF